MLLVARLRLDRSAPRACSAIGWRQPASVWIGLVGMSPLRVDGGARVVGSLENGGTVCTTVATVVAPARYGPRRERGAATPTARRPRRRFPESAADPVSSAPSEPKSAKPPPGGQPKRSTAGHRPTRACWGARRASSRPPPPPSEHPDERRPSTSSRITSRRAAMPVGRGCVNRGPEDPPGP